MYVRSISIIQIYQSMAAHESNMEIQIWMGILDNEIMDSNALSMIIPQSYPMTSLVELWNIYIFIYMYISKSVIRILNLSFSGK